MQKLLVSVRGKNEAIEAVRGGAHIIDAEYPGSALGTPYPLNIYAIRQSVPLEKLVATNIGEKQFVWSTASQAALGVAFAGADIIKVGLAGLKQKKAIKVMERIIHHVHYWFPWKILIAVFFADEDLRKLIDPIKESQRVALESNVQGVLIDTFDKSKGKGLLDYLSKEEIKEFAEICHSYSLEAWIAGSITKDQLESLWRTEVDVICIREAACEKGRRRMGKVKRDLVEGLIKTIPLS